jgi:hypothetical protein
MKDQIVNVNQTDQTHRNVIIRILEWFFYILNIVCASPGIVRPTRNAYKIFVW